MYRSFKYLDTEMTHLNKVPMPIQEYYNAYDAHLLCAMVDWKILKATLIKGLSQKVHNGSVNPTFVFGKNAGIHSGNGRTLKYMA